MNPCPYDHAEMQSYGHDKCPYCRMLLTTINGLSYSDAPETEARTFVTAMGPPLIGEDEKRMQKNLARVGGAGRISA